MTKITVKLTEYEHETFHVILDDNPGSHPDTMKVLAGLLAGLIITLTTVMKKYVIQPVPKEIYQFHLPLYQENLYLAFQPETGSSEPLSINENIDQRVEVENGLGYHNKTTLSSFEIVRKSCSPKGDKSDFYRNAVEIHLKYGANNEFGYLLNYNENTEQVVLQHSLYSKSRDYPSGHHVWLNGSYQGIKEKYPHRAYQCWVLMPTSNGFHRIVAVPFCLRNIDHLWHRDTTEDRVLAVREIKQVNSENNVPRNFELAVEKLDNENPGQIWQLVPQTHSMFVQTSLKFNPFSNKNGQHILVYNESKKFFAFQFQTHTNFTTIHKFLVFKQSRCSVGMVKIMVAIKGKILAFTASDNKSIKLEPSKDSDSQCWWYKKWSSPVSRTAFVIFSGFESANGSYSTENSELVWGNRNGKLVLEKFQIGDRKQHFYEEVVVDTI